MQTQSSGRSVCSCRASFLLTNAQALLDQYEGPADPSFGIFVTVLAGNELRRTGVVEVQAGIAKFSEADDFCVYLPEGQQWRGNSSIKIVLMGSAHAAEGEHFKGAPNSLVDTFFHDLCTGRCFILAEGRVQLGEHFKAGAKGFLAGTSSVLCTLALPAQSANSASASSSVMRGKMPLKVVRKTTGATCMRCSFCFRLMLLQARFNWTSASNDFASIRYVIIFNYSHTHITNKLMLSNIVLPHIIIQSEQSLRGAKTSQNKSHARRMRCASESITNCTSRMVEGTTHVTLPTLLKDKSKGDPHKCAYD